MLPTHHEEEEIGDVVIYFCPPQLASRGVIRGGIKQPGRFDALDDSSRVYPLCTLRKDYQA